MSTKYSHSRSLVRKRNTRTDSPNRTSNYDSYYQRITTIDGSHDWRQAVPGAYVDYPVRARHGGSIRFFNFDLGKEMGLIPSHHPNQMNSKLEAALLETFAIQIINEYDIARKTKFPDKDIKPNRYMATRYLQLQHKDKTGTTSGDGRSIWNGQFSARGTTWDISSCGTGVTILSPGAVEADKPIKTGGGTYSYGSGRAGVDEGVSAAILSEIFNQKGIATERVLCVVEYADGSAVNVRASKNLIRPSHLFNHLKQNNLTLLQSGYDYFIQRQIQNDNWKINPRSAEKYEQALGILTKKYAEFAAALEDEYVFCWLDWDGDNMLATGGILDYGSIRKMGICHYSYRYDDVDRMSTNLFEQKQKAKYLVQTFAQLTDFLNTGVKKPLGKFANDKHLRLFDTYFQNARRANILKLLGFNETQAQHLLQKEHKLIDKFLATYRWFEKQKNNQGYRKVGDGTNWAAVYNIRNAIRFMPKHFNQNKDLIPAVQFLKIIAADGCPKSLLVDSPARRSKVREIQRNYLRLIDKVQKNPRLKFKSAELIMRSSAEIGTDMVTGDGIIFVTERLLRARKKLTRNQFITVMRKFIEIQTKSKTLSPDDSQNLDKKCETLLEGLFKLVHLNRHSI